MSEFVPDAGLAVRTYGLRKSFGHTLAVSDLDLAVGEGEVVGLVGPDGAGKTTTFRLLMGLLRPDAGSVWVRGCDMAREAPRARALLGYVAQQFSLYGDLSVAENIDFAAEVRGLNRREAAARADALLKLTGLAPFTARLARDLSGGMKRKLALTCALLHRPSVVILDEPTTGVDPVTRREFWRLLYRLPEEGVTLLVSTPYLDEAERCHRLAFMAQGRLLAFDTPAGLIGQMPDDLVRIRTPARAAAWRMLKTRPEVRWVDAAEGTLRVAFRSDGPNPEGGAALGRWLAGQGVPVEGCEPAAPVLADVFSSLSLGGAA